VGLFDAIAPRAQPGLLYKTSWNNAAAALPLLLALALCASGPTYARADVVIVGNDYGSVLIPRLANLQAIKLRGATVEISGDICVSACTLYLGLGTTCIIPKTKFGFHGPSQHGKPFAASGL
jgi:hypothetical protein